MLIILLLVPIKLELLGVMLPGIREDQAGKPVILMLMVVLVQMLVLGRLWKDFCLWGYLCRWA